MNIVTFSGKARHGKDTSAKILKDILEFDGKRVLIIHMADYLKFICGKYYKWDGNKDEAGRRILQITGTEKVRSRFPDFWVDTVIRFVEVFKDDFDYILIPDTRFPNEIDKLIESEFRVLSVNVFRINFENDLTPEQRLHSSEIALDDYDFDYCVESNSGMNNLAIEIQKMYNYYKEIYW